MKEEAHGKNASFQHNVYKGLNNNGDEAVCAAKRVASCVTLVTQQFQCSKLDLSETMITMLKY